MSQLNASNFNNLNANVYKLATNAKIVSALPTEFQSLTGNNVNSSEIVDIINITRIREAINKLESSFSYNCCQSNCNSTSTKCQTTICQYTTCQSVSTSCQTCQRYYNYG
jgi:hypothetical protein